MGCLVDYFDFLASEIVHFQLVQTNSCFTRSVLHLSGVSFLLVSVNVLLVLLKKTVLFEKHGIYVASLARKT